MTLVIARHHYRRLTLIGALLLAMLAVGNAVSQRVTDSDNGKSVWRLAVDHMKEDKDIRDKIGAAWMAYRKLHKNFYPHIHPR